MIKHGKTAGLGALTLAISATGLLGMSLSASASPTSPASSQQASSSATFASSAATTAGCAATKASIPAGANRAKTVDVDGDGRADTLWNSGSKFGIRTASGATFSGKFANAGGPEAAVEALKLGNGSTVVMELGRLDYANAVINCRIVPTKNAQGEQYAFDHGFLKAGSNWGVATIKGKKQLVGLQLRTISKADGLYGVDETPIVLHKSGRTATNGKVHQLKHNGRTFMSKSTANKTIAAIVKAGHSATFVTTPDA